MSKAQSGVMINDVPVMNVQVDVRLPNAAPYTATFSQLMTPQLASQLTLGGVVPLRVHPQKPTEIILESA